ncbi:metallophosphoesterase [Stakelama saccharophila]|uniref:Metallophosphoesterase n=1 Tax=Stakelama saccharophila TaxID=3075605 RepID=A0ABZ0B7D9_9SPHN|nr:metallophosphoesterase [Stakelama sp. W311]WNO53026.1 metallophosphoesterase [Stakelama sp. W311]
MFPFLKSRRQPQQYFLPDGERVYAIGDIHGRLDLFEKLLASIAEDDAERGAGDSTIILLGDLINRGPDSAGVVQRAKELREAGGRIVKGNHEEMFVRAAKGEAKGARALIQMGGIPTLMSYGISQDEAEHGSFQDLADLLVERIPRDHVAFLDMAEDTIAMGDYLFVHAGIRPGVPLEQQTSADLRWIRERFLKAKRNDGRMVVHGHTPAREIDVQADRIGVDTGAFMWGILSAVGLEGGERWFLAASEE